MKYIVITYLRGEWYAIKRNNRTRFFDTYEDAAAYIKEMNYSSHNLDMKVVAI